MCRLMAAGKIKPPTRSLVVKQQIFIEKQQAGICIPSAVFGILKRGDRMERTNRLIGAWTNRTSKFSVKLFLMILFLVVLPLAGICVYVEKSMEEFIQEKISQRVIQNISRSERDITQMLRNLSVWSNSFALDEELLDRMQNPALTEYENVRYFNRIVDKMCVTTGDDLINHTKIILFDNYGRVYSNWSLNYLDFEFLLEEEWVKACQDSDGSMSWALFSPVYIPDEQKKEETYISLARPILKYGTAGQNIGTLIMSVGQYEFSNALMTYAYEGDVAYICTEDGTVAFKNDVDKKISPGGMEQIHGEVDGSSRGSILCREQGVEYLVSYYTIPGPCHFNGQKVKVFHFTNYQDVIAEVSDVAHRMTMVVGIAVGLVILLTFVTVRILVRPIVLLTGKMKNYTIDQEITGIDVYRRDEIGSLNRAFLDLGEKVRLLFRKLEEENRIKERYHYESLRAQLNPHFLFNTLTTIRWMAMIRGADNIVESIDALVHVLKYSISKDDSLVTLKEELDNIENYVRIHNYRYEKYCSLDIDIPEELQKLMMMKFILQPVVENALIHGYDKSREQIVVRIYGYTEENLLYLFVEDDGVGISQSVIQNFEATRHRGSKKSKMTGIGLDNVDTCIRITFGEEYGLKLERCGSRGTSVTFCLPIILGEENGDEKNHDCG